MNRQYEMNIQRSQYQADLAQRRFEQVDPANRLVATSLEKSWNLELEKLAAAEKEYIDSTTRQEKEFSASRKSEIAELAAHIPELWTKTKNVKDKKRIIRLLIKDITVTRNATAKTLTLNICWQTGQLQQIEASLPPNVFQVIKYSEKMVEQVRNLAKIYADNTKIVEILNSQDIVSATGKPFTKDMVRWIRFRYQIERPLVKTEQEYTVTETTKMFNVSKHMVYYWVDRKYVQARKLTTGFLIKIPPVKAEELRLRIKSSYKTPLRSIPS